MKGWKSKKTEYCTRPGTVSPALLVTRTGITGGKTSEPADAEEMIKEKEKETAVIDDRTGDLILTVHGSTETIPAEMFERYVKDYGHARAIDILQTMAEESFEHEIMDGRVTGYPDIRAYAPYGYED